MDLDTIFQIKILATFLVAGLLFKYMMVLQKRKEDEAERKYQMTLAAIEARNRKQK
jgi:hypothetical protein